MILHWDVCYELSKWHNVETRLNTFDSTLTMFLWLCHLLGIFGHIDYRDDFIGTDLSMQFQLKCQHSVYLVYDKLSIHGTTVFCAYMTETLAFIPHLSNVSQCQYSWLEIFVEGWKLSAFMPKKILYYVDIDETWRGSAISHLCTCDSLHLNAHQKAYFQCEQLFEGHVNL